MRIDSIAVLITLLTIVVICTCSEMAIGDSSATQPVKRTTIVVDSSGTKTEVTDLEFTNDDWRFDRHQMDVGKPDDYFMYWDPSDWIAIKTTTFEFAIRLDSLISIEAKGKKVEVKYLWLNKEQTLQGSLESGTFQGKSDFGKFELASVDLKQLKSNPVPSNAPLGTMVTVAPEQFNQIVHAVENMIKTPFDATLVLLDGTKIKIGNLNRQYKWILIKHEHFANESRSNQYDFYDDFQFLRGKALASTSLDSLTSIEFGKKDDVTITTKDGKKATGTLTDSNEIVNGNNHFAGITAFSGISENGIFLIDPKEVKAIQFNLNSGTAH